MWSHIALTPFETSSLIRDQSITVAGNRKLKIYGTLSCGSGKRMKRQNRVFFVSEKEAIEAGYRPCGHCMRKKYQVWIYSTLTES